MSSELNPKRKNRGCIIRRGRKWVLLISNRKRGSRGPAQQSFVLGSLDELPTINDARAAAGYVSYVGPLTIAGLMRARHVSEGQRLPKFSATWFMEKLKEQEYRCVICQRTPQRLVVDHDHFDGRLRGLLCSCCNSGIGMLKDDIALLRAAIAYLESYGK